LKIKSGKEPSLTSWFAALGRHKWLKLLSFFLAVLLWFSVGGEERTETTLILSLELVNLRPHLMVVGEVPPNIQVRVIGPRSTIRSLSQARLAHTIDLSRFDAGDHSIPLGPGAFSFPRGITVARVHPNPLDLSLAATITRTLPIRPSLTASPPEGFEVQRVKTRPDHVTVKGVAAELEELTEITTLPIDLSNLSGPVTLATDLDFRGLHLTLKEPVPILVDLVIAEKIVKRTISGVQVYASPESASLTPSTLTVTLTGPYRRLKELTAAEILATVDTKNLLPGRHNLQVSVQVPNGFKLESLSPQTVTARIAKPS
jgi:YbbR domain-containing protein